MHKDIVMEIAYQTARKFGRADADFAAKMSRRLRRKFELKVSKDEILELALRFSEIYRFATARLMDCIRPSADGYARSSNVDDEKYLALLVEKFPEEPPDILSTISGWVVFYDYLH